MLYFFNIFLRYIQWREISYTHLRPAMFMNNISDYARANRDQIGTLIHYTGSQRVAWIDTDDIGLAAANILASAEQHLNRTYFMAAEALSPSIPPWAWIYSMCIS